MSLFIGECAAATTARLVRLVSSTSDWTTAAFGTQLPLAVMQVDVSNRMLSGHSEDVGDCGF